MFLVHSEVHFQRLARQSRAADGDAIGRGRRVAQEAFHSLTFKKAKIEPNHAGSRAEVREHLCLRKSSPDDRGAPRWQRTERETKHDPPPPHLITSAPISFAYLTVVPFLDN